MPQLDAVTYLGQVTWFVLVFGVYYLVMVAEVLPALDRALKMRVKKVALTRGDARQFDRERLGADEGYGRSLASAAATSVGLLMACQEALVSWASDAVSALRQGEGSSRSSANQACVAAMVETSASSLALTSRMEGATIKRPRRRSTLRSFKVKLKPLKISARRRSSASAAKSGEGKAKGEASAKPVKSEKGVKTEKVAKSVKPAEGDKAVKAKKKA